MKKERKRENYKGERRERAGEGEKGESRAEKGRWEKDRGQRRQIKSLFCVESETHFLVHG